MIKDKDLLARQKGTSLVFAVVILSLVLSIGLGLSILFVQQVKGTEEIGYSVKAFYGADSGVEKVLLLDPPQNASGTIGQVSYEVEVTTGGSPQCSASNYCIKSKGTFKKIQRAVEISY